MYGRFACNVWILKFKGDCMNKKKIILILIVIIVIILLIVFFVTRSNIGKDDLSKVEIYDPIVPEVSEMRNETAGKITTLESRGFLYTVKTCLSKFFTQCSYLNTDDDVKEIVYSMLNNEYINSKDITVDNISEKLGEYEDSTVEIYYVYCLTYYGNVKTYFVQGALNGNITNTLRNYKLVLNLDEMNGTFEIYMGDYLEDINITELKEGDIIDFNVPESVEKRIYNIYSPVSPDISELSTDYLILIRDLLLHDIETAYSMLDDVAKDRYGSIDELRNFVNQNQSQLRFMYYGASDVNVDENGREIYTIYDNKDKFVINVYFDTYSTFTFNIYLL